MERLRLDRSRGKLAALAAGVAAITMTGMSASAQQAQTLNGAPIQMQPFVVEPGAPTVTVDPGTPNPFGGLDGGNGSGSSGDSGGGGGSGSSDALSTLLGSSWGASAAANAQSLGVNASALAGMCVAESGCNSNVANNGSFVGAFQMGPAAFQDGLRTALAANPALASQIVQGSAGINDPTTEAIAASGYLLQANTSLQNAGISNPTTLDARAYYNFGPTYGSAVAQSQPTATMASVLSASYLAPNGISPTETIAQWQASVSSKIGNASGQSIVNS